MLHYVVLQHEPGPRSGRPLHWDLMLESGGVLRTWAMPSAPELEKTVSAEQLAEHRIDYLDYEGPVSKERGFVQRWDHGQLIWLEEAPHRLTAELRGRELRCDVELVADPNEPHKWTISFKDAGGDGSGGVPPPSCGQTREQPRD